MGDAAQDAGGAAAGGYCSAELGPEAGPLCASAGAEIVGAIEGFLSSPSCSGWFCSQDTPEAWAHWMSPNAIAQVNAAFNAWLASGDPALAPFLVTVTHSGGAPSNLFIDGHVTGDIPCGTLRRAMLSKWYQTYVGKHGVGYDPGPLPASPLPWNTSAPKPDPSAPKLTASALALAAEAAKLAKTQPMSTGKKVALGALAVVAVGAAGWVGYRAYTGQPVFGS